MKGFKYKFTVLLTLIAVLMTSACGGGGSSSSGSKMAMPSAFHQPIEKAVNRINSHPMYAADYRRVVSSIVYGGPHSQYYGGYSAGVIYVFEKMKEYAGNDNAFASLIAHEMVHGVVGSAHSAEFYAYYDQMISTLGISDMTIRD